MRVAALQMDIAWEEPEHNFGHARELARRAVESGAELLALPEMFATGYTMRSEQAAAHANGTMDFVSGLATDHGVWVIAGLAEPAAGPPVNTAVVVSPDGSVAGRYHKIHPFRLAGEHHHYAAGNRLLTVEAGDLRLTPLVCYDLRFPELFRIAAAATDLFVVIANWPTARSHHWRALLSTRAVDSLAWVLGVNRVGVADGHDHRGDSSLVDPMGLVVASLAEQAGVVVGEVDREAVDRTRTRLHFLDDRRPELYRRLEAGNTEPTRER